MLLKIAQQTKTNSKSKIEKTLELFQFMLFGSLLITLGEHIFTSATESVLNKASSFSFKWQWQSLLLPSDCDGVCLSKASDLYYKWQWWGLWRSLFLLSCSCSLFLVNSQVFTINGSDVVCDGAFFMAMLWWSLF